MSPEDREQIRMLIETSNVPELLDRLTQAPDLLAGDAVVETWLHYAAENGTIDVIDALLGLGLDINDSSGIGGGRPINYAISEERFDIVKHLVSKGAVLDTSASVNNPIFDAVYVDNPEIAQFLIDQGIDFRKVFKGEKRDHWDTFTFAKDYGRQKVLAVLLSAEQKYLKEHGKG